MTANAVRSPSILSKVSGLLDADHIIRAARNNQVKAGQTTGVKITSWINSRPDNVTDSLLFFRLP